MEPAANRRAIGRNIRGIRRLRGRTQKEIAEALGISPATLSAWENGSRAVPSDRLIDIASLLQCRVRDLLPEE